MPKRKAAAVSMEEGLHEESLKRAHALGFSTFSAYVVQLIRADLAQRGEMTLRESPGEYRANPRARIGREK